MHIKSLTTKLGAVGLFLCALSLLLLPGAAAAAAKDALDLCAGTLLPSLFPFFVLTELWVSLGIAGTMSRAAGRWMRPLFHLPGAAAPALLLGAVGGYPVGAQAVCRLHRQGSLTRQEAENTLFFCNNAGPAFLLGVVGQGMFQSTAVGAALMAIHLLSAVLLGILFRPQARPAFRLWPEPAPLPLREALPQSVRQAGKSFFSVCLFVIFFSVVTSILQALVPQGVASSGLFTLLLGALELAGGTVRLSALSWPVELKFAVAALLLGFGGVCVQMQTLSLLSQERLTGRRFLPGKLLQGLLSFAIALAVAPFLPLPEACAAGAPLPLGLLAGLLLSIVLLGGLAIYTTKITTGNPGEYQI